MANFCFTLFIIFTLELVLHGMANDFEYFQMVQQWPPAKCSAIRVPCNIVPPTMFTIHGLWPSNFTNIHLTYCNRNIPFDQNSNKFVALIPQLSIYWPDVVHGNDQRFWKRQWNKHGTCSSPHFDQFDYFQTSLSIRTDQSYDLLSILNDAGFNPTTNHFRGFKDMEGAIEKRIGVKPGFRCNVDARTRSRQLYEIVLCFKKDGVTLIHCPSYISMSCPSWFKW